MSAAPSEAGQTLRIAMTPAPRSRGSEPASARPKPLEPHGSGLVARALLAVPAMALGACLFPPDLAIGDVDAGVSSPPVVERVLPPEDFASPGPPIQLARGEAREMTLLVRDNELDDSLFVRFFVNYDRPTRPNPVNFVASCSAPGPAEQQVRSIVCNTETLCGPDTELDVEHFLEAVISDRPFLTDTNDPRGAGQLPFRAIVPGGSTTVTAWTLICLAPLQE
jgi:hypothetical protein